MYNHQIFNSTAAFVAAYHDGTLARLPSRPDQDPSKTDYAWSTRRRPAGAPVRDLDERPGPRSVAFGGARFRLDRAQQYVSWMGWSVYLGFDRDMGLSLWDVQFRGDRIAYEVRLLLSPSALRELPLTRVRAGSCLRRRPSRSTVRPVLLFLVRDETGLTGRRAAGNDPMQTTTAWLDRYFGMGLAVRDLLPGYDCPHGAAYLPATSFGALGYLARERAVCVFEADVGRPLSRHTGYSDGEFGAIKGYVLTVRTISTVGK